MCAIVVAPAMVDHATPIFLSSGAARKKALTEFVGAMLQRGGSIDDIPLPVPPPTSARDVQRHKPPSFHFSHPDQTALGGKETGKEVSEAVVGPAQKKGDWSAGGRGKSRWHQRDPKGEVYGRTDHPSREVALHHTATAP